MAIKFKTVNQYVESFPEETRKILQSVREVIQEELPAATEVISYNIAAFCVDKQNVIHFAGWKKHISLYPFSAAMVKDITEASKYDTSGKGTIKFPLDEPMPVALIRKIVRYRLKEVMNKKAK